MNNRANDNFGYPGLEITFESIARWIKNYREAFSAAGQLAECGPQEVAKIARELMISPRELAGLAWKGPETAKLLQLMLVALGVDASKLAANDKVVLRDLQRLCIACAYKRQCEWDLANGTAAENYGEYCPNAYTLEALTKAQSNL